MPETNRIEAMFDGQVDIKFYGKKHQYFRRINSDNEVLNTITFTDHPNKDVLEATFPESETEWNKIPSTTSVTQRCLDKPFLYNWLVDVTARTFKQCINKGMTVEDSEGKAKGARFKAMKKGGNIGTNVHNWINEFVLHMIDDKEHDAPDIDSLETDERNCVFGFLEWWEDNVQEPLQTEYLVYHPLLDTGGTLDFIFINSEGDLEIVDFKTGYTINPGDVMQIAFYRKGYALRHGDMPDVATILHLQKDKPEAIPLRSLNHDASMIAFECGHYLVNWRDTLKF